MSAENTKPLRPDAERTSNIIVRDIEDSQIDKFAELHGQCSCEKSNKMLAKYEAAQYGR